MNKLFTTIKLNRSSFSLFIAVLVHLVFLLLFTLIDIITEQRDTKENRIKIELKQIETKPIKKPKPIKKIETQPIKKVKSGKIKKTPPKKTPPAPIAPPMPKGKQLKKIIEKSIVEHEEKEIPKVEKKEKPKYSWLREDPQENNVTKKVKKVLHASSISRNLKEAYGDEFGKLSIGQQKYILDNQEIMRRITQQVLTRVAHVNIPRDINVNKINLIEFYLHPNGDMTDFKFIKKSGYYMLDDTTQETIDYAYSRYPRPKEKTLIRFYVHYNLSRY
jgi:outer membrane biosynthesis protein TonB